MKTFSIKPSINEKRLFISCPVCGGSDFKDHWDCGEYSFVQCRICRLVLQNPQPVFEHLDNRYDEDYFKYEQKNEQLFFQLMLKSLSDISFETKPEDPLLGKSFLDIGCATGALVEYMKNEGWDSKGVELCEQAADFGSKTRNIDIFSGTVEQAFYDDNQFDVIHCSHLIEHLNNPALYLDEVVRILKPGGLFLCTTPNSDGFQAKLFGSKWRSAIADHMFLFSRKNLQRLMKSRNFTIEKVRTWGGLGQGYGPRWFKKILDSTAKKLSFGDVMIISARNKE